MKGKLVLLGLLCELFVVQCPKELVEVQQVQVREHQWGVSDSGPHSSMVPVSPQTPFANVATIYLSYQNPDTTTHCSCPIHPFQ
jgi:hypothetical protein